MHQVSTRFKTQPMKAHYLVTCTVELMVQSGCSQNADSQTETGKIIVALSENPLEVFLTLPTATYDKTNAAIHLKRDELRSRYESANSDSTRNSILDEAGNEFTAALVFQLMPYWYGTTWAFEGHTDIPGQGEVACGYLVSTTWKHAGMNMNRYKFAQQASYVGSKTLANGNKPEKLSGKTPAEVEAWFVANKRDGLYSVGLDYHTGFVYLKDKALYFIHSSFAAPVAVTVERVTDSPVFGSSAHYFVDLTRNRELMKKWILGLELIIIK